MMNFLIWWWINVVDAGKLLLYSFRLRIEVVFPMNWTYQELVTVKAYYDKFDKRGATKTDLDRISLELQAILFLWD